MSKKQEDKKKHEGKDKKKALKGTRVVNEKKLSIDELRTVFENILTELQAGSLRVADDDKELTLTLPDEMKLRIKADRNDKKEKYSLKLSWPVNPLASDQPEDTKAE